MVAELLDNIPQIFTLHQKSHDEDREISGALRAAPCAPASQRVTPFEDFLLYQTEDDPTRVECRCLEESLWLSQKLMAELFDVSVPTVNEHLKTLYESAEMIRRQLLGNSE